MADLPAIKAACGGFLEKQTREKRGRAGPDSHAGDLCMRLFVNK
ncbi:MAG TPA: hypothetical protein VGF67_16495 [Ktedonobacteraceae bacterium]